MTYAKGCTITREGGDWFADAATLAHPDEDTRDIAAAVELARGCDDVVVVGGNEGEPTVKVGMKPTSVTVIPSL